MKGVKQNNASIMLSTQRAILKTLILAIILCVASALSGSANNDGTITITGTSPATPNTKPTTAVQSSSDYRSHMRAKIAHSVAKGERRAGERDAGGRNVCLSCQRPPTLCLCDVLPDTKYSTNTKILILQHPNERRKKNLSTVPLLKLVLANVQVVGGYTFQPENLPIVQEMLDQGRRPFLLYPSDDAISLDNIQDGGDAATSISGNVGSHVLNDNNDNTNHNNLLIMIDGTWSEAKRMVRDSPALLEHCQAVQFSSDASSIYDALRREPEDHCLSTLEACAQALALLEPSSPAKPASATAATVSATTPASQVVIDHLHAVLQAHVDAHLVNSQIMAPRSVGAATAKLYAKNRRRREIELTMFSSENNNNNQQHQERATVPSYRETLPDGAILRSLQTTDAALVDSWWEYQSSKSLPLMMRRIGIDQANGGGGCFGIELEGQLVACILRYEGGALGMMYVEEHARRRGYGMSLLQHATNVLQEQGEERVAFIVDGNGASEALFMAAGWERADPHIKRKTGKRKAKRKWVHNPLVLL